MSVFSTAQCTREMSSFYFWILVTLGREEVQRSREAACIIQASCVSPALFQHCRARVTFEKSSRGTVGSENISQGSLTGGGVGSCLRVEIYRLPGPK